MACYATAFPRRPSRQVTHFPRFQSSGGLAPLFHLLDEAIPDFHQPSSRPIRSFQPRFDVREESDAYHLVGEIPGIEQKDVQIEFVDRDTIVVRGRSARESTTTITSDEGQKKAVEATAPAAEAEKPIEAKNDDAASDVGSASSAYHKTTVEDEFVEVESQNEKAPEAAPATPAATNTVTTATAQPTPAPEPEQQQQKKPKYWVSERSVGEFKRSFTFAGKVNQDAVTASLKNGILNITVPKAAPEQRKISIS